MPNGYEISSQSIASKNISLGLAKFPWNHHEINNNKHLFGNGTGKILNSNSYQKLPLNEWMILESFVFSVTIPPPLPPPLPTSLLFSFKILAWFFYNSDSHSSSNSWCFFSTSFQKYPMASIENRWIHISLPFNNLTHSSIIPLLSYRLIVCKEKCRSKPTIKFDLPEVHSLDETFYFSQVTLWRKIK